jgi:electron transfer flavoprotein beta subunit
MRALVLLGEGADVRVPPQRDPRSGRVREEWLVREVDPASARALEVALALKDAGVATEVTVLHMGPETTETYLQQALARGCDRAIRVWDEQAEGLHTAAAAAVLGAAAQAAGFDVVVCGASGVVDAGGQLGQLLAAQLGLPCVTQAVEISGADSASAGGGTPGEGAPAAHGAPAEDGIEILRQLDGGYRERVRADLPVVVTVSPPAGSGSPAMPVVPARALLAAQQCDLPVWDLADLGVPFEEVRRAEQSLTYSEARPRRPRLIPIAAPDPSLPAFERILKLIEGTVKRREGRVVKGPAEVLAEEIFATLRDEGWLGHLRPTREGESSGTSRET